ncbi:PREDICTED: uncharacterized protein LOC108358342 [Rhagoletis zephyria]|uniref:uncharacterized protein LOC108358342 n=1 Tax=Rhagoletis zephyria TaxID=28612 RepID=UPI00081160F3|nr:PREDICTED: uncharacterized protein LOC108358342 [Rhagoletis zephyria]
MAGCTPAHLPISHHTGSAAIVKLHLLLLLLLLSYLLSACVVTPFTITGRYCKQNISSKYQVAVRHSTQSIRRAAAASERTSADHNTAANNIVTSTTNGSYVTYEPRVRWEATNICCPGYRTLLFGFCEPICEQVCPRFSYCATPNQCECLSGYEEHHPNNKEQQLLDCRPICVGGCPRHSHCVARNRCVCSEGFRNANTWWFMPLKCERIRCSALDQRYDVAQRACVKIEMSMEDLMRKVAERLTKGLNDLAGEYDDEEGEDEGENGGAKADDHKEEEQNDVLKEALLDSKNKANVKENNIV